MEHITGQDLHKKTAAL